MSAIHSRRKVGSTLMMLLVAGVTLVQAEVPNDFDATYESLSELLDREELGPLELAKGTYDATRFFAVGVAGGPSLEQKFRAAQTLGSASLAGLYLTVWGQQRQFDLIRSELERRPAKRNMMYSLAGTEKIFFSSLEAGAQYQPMLRLLPSVGGTRTLTRQLLDSHDALVRRAGMFWGYWLADASYWKRVKELAAGDADVVTQSIARRLVKKAMDQAK